MAIEKERELRTGLLERERQEKSFQIEIEKLINQSKDDQSVFAEWEQNRRTEIQQWKDKIERFQEKLCGLKINALNLDLDYEALQLSNPWFGIEYRRLQSQLFIKALEVRKEFLYANIKNIKAAYIIWSKQKDYLEHKNIIAEAWHWINMTIPIIGSTFAQLFKNVYEYGQGNVGSFVY